MDETRFMRACLLRDEGKLKEATREFISLAEETSDAVDRAGILWNAASTCMVAGDYGLARQQLKAVRTLIPALDSFSPSDPDDRLFILRLGVVTEEADLCYVEGKKEEGLAKLNHVLDRYGETLRDPPFREGFHYAQLLRAYLQADLGSWKEALPVLEGAQAYNGPQAEHLVNFYLGHCYICAGAYLKAKPKLVEALRLGLPPSLEYRAHCELGMVYFSLEHYARAKIEFEKCAESAGAAYLERARIWKYLETTCRQLGLAADADHYAELSRQAG